MRCEQICRRAVTLALLLVAIATSLVLPRHACADEGPAEAGEVQLEYNSMEELAGKQFGAGTGTVEDQLISDAYEGIDLKDFDHYNSYAELIVALRTHKCEAFFVDEPIALLIASRYPDIGYLPEPAIPDHYGLVLHKDSELTSLFNERIAAYRTDGTIDALREKWMGADEDAKVPPVQDWETPNGTLDVMVYSDLEPMSYLKDGEPAGLSVALVLIIARDLGYGVKMRATNNASAFLAEVQTGKADIGAGSVSITEERKRAMDMTDAYYDGGLMAMVRRVNGAAAAEDVGFFAGVAASFQRTFVVEGRWKLIVQGLGVSLLIALSSGALGAQLGYLLVGLRRRGSARLSRAIDAYEALIGGLPAVVVLMVFYYVILGSLDISNLLVSIVGFALIFGASAEAIMWNAIQAIDVGQSEASRALGFCERDTFRHVVLPQAARQFLPNLRGQFVSLIKDTSIVGYIAVEDLTRAADLIRSRTLEAFFPLLTSAAIYFAICRIAARIATLYIQSTGPKKESRTIKGVEL